VSGDSLVLDWHKVCPKGIEDKVYVIGNPPFLGTLGRSDEQRANMQAVFNNDKALGYLFTLPIQRSLGLTMLATRLPCMW